MQEECQAGSSLGHLHAAIATRLERPERGGQPVDVPADRGEDEDGENRCGPEPTRCVVVPGDKPGPKKHDHPEVPAIENTFGVRTSPTADHSRPMLVARKMACPGRCEVVLKVAGPPRRTA
jgi:hypothetical protein